MSRSLDVVLDVPVAVEAAFAVLSTERWVQVLRDAQDDDARVESTSSTDTTTTIVHSHQLPDGAPGWVSKVLPRDGRVVQTDVWGRVVSVAGARAGTWEVGFPGAPGKATGTYVLAPALAGCTWTVAGQVTLNIPLVGGRIEGYVVEMLGKLLAQEAAALAKAAG